MSQKDEEELYCICQSRDSGSFMICCDCCEKWYHTSCLGITRSFAKNVKTFYCFVCQNKNPDLKIEYVKDSSKKKRDKSKVSIGLLLSNHIQRACLMQRDVIDDFPLSYPPLKDRKHAKKRKHQSDEETESDDSQKRIKREELDDSDDEFRPSGNQAVSHETKKSKKQATSSKRGRKKADEKSKASKDEHKTKNWRGAGRKPKEYLKEKSLNKEANVKTEKRKYERKEKKDKKDDKDRDEKEDEKAPRHCIGPACINQAIKNSKYCSDACGVALARKRIIEILPGKIEQWKAIPSKSDELNHKQLERLRKEFIDTRAALEELDRRKQELERIIAISKEIQPMTEEECNEQECELDSELSTYCVTCGHEVNYRNAARHMGEFIFRWIPI